TYGNAVILIDDGNNAQLQKFIQGVLQVLVAHRRSEVVVRKQKLGHHLLTKKELFVSVHQQTLTNGGAGLHLGHTRGLFLQAKVQHAGSNRAGTDNQIFVLRQVQLVHERAYLYSVKAPTGSNQTGADFDDQAHKGEPLM